MQPALAGDAAVERLIETNGFVANGGVMHAIEVLESDSSVADAVAAFRFFGLDLAAEALEFAASRFAEWETDDEAGDDIEGEADRLYNRQQLSDEALQMTAERLRTAHPELFATD